MNQSEENRLFSGILAALTSAVFFAACLKILALLSLWLRLQAISSFNCCFAGTVILFLSFVPALLPHIPLSDMRLFTIPCGALYMFYSVRNRNTALF